MPKIYCSVEWVGSPVVNAVFSVQARIQLARLYLDVGTLDASEHECLVMLQSDPAHEEAPIVLSEVAFQKRDWNAAVQHLKNLLDKRRGELTHPFLKFMKFSSYKCAKMHSNTYVCNCAYMYVHTVHMYILIFTCSLQI